MAKNSVRDFDATAANNTDIESVNIAEGCAPSGINNAIRELMADMKDVSAGTIALESPQANSITISDATEPSLRFLDTNAANSDFTIYSPDGENQLRIKHQSTDRISIKSSGDLFVSKTSQNVDTVGHELRADGVTVHTADGAVPLFLNRQSSDGAITVFQQAGSTDGQINVISGDIAIGTGNTGFRFGSSAILPHNVTTNALRDNAIDLGSGSYRYDDIFATNGTIQTSDRNEKQQIASLTDAEITAAKAISKLFKTFKWNDSVAENGDNARTHSGVIAQDVQSAMTDAGLDAGDYAFFISTTWWETQADVPAVAAVAAQDAVLDDDGNIVTEAVEAVEARDAYTRTDIYDTADEAPEGATERTRLGIRYPELLAFIGAATEQRLADIETRLTALEA